METRNLPDAEFKTLVIRMLSEIRVRTYDLKYRTYFKQKNRKIKMERENIKRTC